MSVYVSSDLHLNHRNILKYCPDRRNGKDMPESDFDVANMVSTMNETIIRNWNSVITPNDQVWILGDVAMGQIEKAPSMIRRLNGAKTLIKGNHDVTITKRIRSGDPEYVGLFEEIHSYYEMSYKTTDTNRKVLINMMHYPLHSWNGMSQNSLMLHGHCHGTPTGLTGRIKDVGLDTNNLFPYKLDDVVNELLKIEVTRSHH